MEPLLKPRNASADEQGKLDSAMRDRSTNWTQGLTKKTRGSVLARDLPDYNMLSRTRKTRTGQAWKKRINMQAGGDGRIRLNFYMGGETETGKADKRIFATPPTSDRKTGNDTGGTKHGHSAAIPTTRYGPGRRYESTELDFKLGTRCL